MTTTWNPADSGAGTFSNGNRTIAGSGSSWATTRATAPVGRAKIYVEATIDANGTAAGSNGDWALGVANSIQSKGALLGPDGTAGFAYFPWTGLIFANGGTGTLQTGAVGTTVCLQFDTTALTFAVRINGGSWSASHSFSSMRDGPFFLAFCVEGSDSRITCNFGANAFNFSVPSGYQSYDDAVIPVTSDGADTFDPVKTAANATLSNGNLTITTTTAAYSLAQTLIGKTSGKLYFEVKADSIGGTDAFSVGVAKYGSYLNNVTGVEALGVGYSVFDSSFRWNNTQEFNSLGGTSAGTVFGVAVDFTNKRVWVRGSSGVWNGNSSANPETNTDGANGSGGLYAGDLDDLLAGPLYPTVGVYNNSQGTINLVGPFAGTVPAGFSAWDSVPSTNGVMVFLIG